MRRRAKYTFNAPFWCFPRPGRRSTIASSYLLSKTEQRRMTASTLNGPWLELVTACDAEAVEAVAAIFAEHGLNQGVVIEEPFRQDPDDATVQVDLSLPVTVSTFLLDQEVAEEAIDGIRDSLRSLGEYHGVSNLVVRNLIVRKREEDDWDSAWLAHSSMHRVGRHIVVKAWWHDYDPEPDETVLEIDSGMAFGTGGHASTHLAMMAIEDELVSGMDVLDVGTGSGILAIAAARRGASRVDSVDIDPIAIRVARSNVEQNGAGDIVRIALGSVGPGEPFQGEYDLVVANILARILIDRALPLSGAVRPGGILILSGIIDSKAPAVRETFAALGFDLIRRDELEGWVMLALRKCDDRSELSLPDPG
jgi:ribosomal protein L11 methyltransferase